jgi:tetratricopeptide (TPR) repeat protein
MELSKRFLALIFIMSLSLASYAQTPDWGEDPGKAKEKYALFTDSYAAKNYPESRIHLDWLLEHTPNLNEDLYTKGVKVYEKIEKAEKDTEAKLVLQDKVLSLYDLRIEHKLYTDEGDVLKRKGRRAYPYLIGRADGKSKIGELYTLYNRIHELNGTKNLRSNLTYLMDLTCRKGKAGDFTDDQVLAQYESIVKVIETNIADPKEAKKVSKWESCKASIDGLLTNCVTIDCNFVKENLGGKLRAEDGTADIKVAKQVMNYMLQGKCTDDPLFMEAVKILYAEHPEECALGKLVANSLYKEDKFDEAIEMYEKVIETSCTDAESQGELYLKLANIKRSKGAKAAARGYAYQALKADPSTKSEVYTLIGNLYMSSFKGCASRSQLESRYVFLAAYDKFQAAGNSSRMAAAQEQFPSMEMIFSENKAVGSSVQTGCWMGETTSLRKR